MWFAASTPDCIATATFYPESDAARYVAEALRAGTRIFKAHLQVGHYDPNDQLLDDVWAMIDDANVPVVMEPDVEKVARAIEQMGAASP